MNAISRDSSGLPVAIWLGATCLLILAVVVIGGVTRLTDSGLSIVEWKPILGTVPPVSESEWETAFEQYRQYPQFQLRNRRMTMSEFKVIYFWEYLHRLAGRLLGVVFLVPYAWFLLRRRIKGALAWQLAGAFILGGLQGFLGWFMVKSGLVDRPYVSHYRLAAHLALALAVLGYLLWLLLKVAFPRRAERPRVKSGTGKAAALGLAALVAVQIVYGAFVAGLDAGFSFNTFPTMMGQWLPPGGMDLTPRWVNLFQNAATVQFIHRLLGWFLLFGVTWFWCRHRKSTAGPSRIALNLLLLFTLGQFALGVATLLLRVPVSVATLHQLGACLLWGSVLGVLHFMRPVEDSRASRTSDRKIA